MRQPPTYFLIEPACIPVNEKALDLVNGQLLSVVGLQTHLGHSQELGMWLLVYKIAKHTGLLQDLA